MANSPHFYSRPLSPDAKAKMIEFMDVYLVCLMQNEVNEKAEIAKQKAIEVLQTTDIDVLVFVSIILGYYHESFQPLIDEAIRGKKKSREVATTITEMMETAFTLERKMRTATDN